MSDRPTACAQLLLLCGKVRDNQLSAEDARRLDQLLQSDDEHKQLYVQYMSVVSLLESQSAGLHFMPGVGESEEAVDDRVLADLLQLERLAEADMVHHLGELRCQEPPKANHPTGKLAVTRVVSGLIAACLALALVLAMLLSGDTPANNRRVATLTAAHHAQWAEAERSVGDSLSAGQKLSLTEGYAELTTDRGARIILESPCTVELLDTPNAIRLHAGRIVGICETKTSKGLIVRTPHMDVTDIGTEFGVHVDPTGQTDVAVFLGHVELSVDPVEPGGDATTLALTAGQASRVLSDGQLDETIQYVTVEQQNAFVRRVQDIGDRSTAYARAIRALKPIVFWPMDSKQPTGTDALGDNRYELVPSSDDWPLPMIDGPYASRSQPSAPLAMPIDGQRCYFSAGPFPSGLWQDNAYSTALWMKADSRQAQNVVALVPSVKQRGRHYSNQIRINSAGHIEHYTFFPTTNNPGLAMNLKHQLDSGQPIQAGQWVHVVATYGDGWSRIYIDGELAAEREVGLRFETTYLYLAIGTSTGQLSTANAMPSFKGSINELALFNRELNSKEIEALFRAAAEAP